MSNILRSLVKKWFSDQNSIDRKLDERTLNLDLPPVNEPSNPYCKIRKNPDGYDVVVHGTHHEQWLSIYDFFGRFLQMKEGIEDGSFSARTISSFVGGYSQQQISDVVDVLKTRSNLKVSVEMLKKKGFVVLVQDNLTFNFFEAAKYLSEVIVDVNDLD